MSLYEKPGVAHFYCPVLVDQLAKLGVKSFEALTPEQDRHFDGGGHMLWKFYWLGGDHHIDHEANGGVPKCSCSRRLVFVWGDNPGHRAT